MTGRQRRAIGRCCALGAKAAGMDISGAMALLAGKEGFLCQYDRHSGRGTVWAVLYDLKRRAVWRAEGSPRSGALCRMPGTYFNARLLGGKELLW